LWLPLPGSIPRQNSFRQNASHNKIRQLLLGFQVVALIFMIHSIPVILYGTLRYSWAWKHVGIVDYIQRHGSVNPDISYLEAYHNWPGFFAFFALLTDVNGAENALGLATWAPVFFNLLNFGALYIIYNAVTKDRRLIWLSIWFFFLTNWVGQDYFSPQAQNFFSHLVILGVCLTWFRVATPPKKETLQRWLKFKWLVSLVEFILQRGVHSDPPQHTLERPQRIGMIAFTLMLFAVIAFSHQITPVMTIISVSALVVFQRCNAKTLPLDMALILLAWYLFGARSFLLNEIPYLITSFGQVSETIDGGLIDLSRASTGQQIVAQVGRILSASIWLLAMIGFFRRITKGYWDLSVWLLAFSPLPMLVANPYGGEMMFRVFLFTLPFITFLAAGTIFTNLDSGRSFFTPFVLIILSTALLSGFFFGYFGKELQYRFSEEEVEAVQYLYSIAPEGSMFIEGSRNYPGFFKNYELYRYVSIAEEPWDSLQEILDQPAETLEVWMSDDIYPETYLFITHGQKAEINNIGEIPTGSLDMIEAALLLSPKFEVIFENDDARIFILADS